MFVSEDSAPIAPDPVEVPRSLPHGNEHRTHLAKICRKLGGKLIRVPISVFNQWDRDFTYESDERGWYPAPFTNDRLALFTTKRAIVYAKDASWVNIIHEMGHLFAGPLDPSYVDEFDFFGWEATLARQVPFSDALQDWIRGNHAYGVDWEGSYDLGSLAPDSVERLLADRESRARAIGLVGPRGKLHSRFKDPEVARIAESLDLSKKKPAVTITVSIRDSGS